MATKKPSRILKQNFIYTNEIDDAIEKETYKNAELINEQINDQIYLKKCWKKIIDVLEIQSEEDSKYFDFTVYEKMVKEQVQLRLKRKEEAEKRKKAKEAKEAKAKEAESRD